MGPPRTGRGFSALHERLAPTPVVELNRAVAVAIASGPAAVSWWATGSGRVAEARAEFERAASLTRNARERGHRARVGYLLDSTAARTPGRMDWATLMQRV